MRWTHRHDYYFALVCLIVATVACSSAAACTMIPILIIVSMVLIVLTALYVALKPGIMKEMGKK